jgi:hypothetical protein
MESELIGPLGEDLDNRRLAVMSGSRFLDDPREQNNRLRM